MSNRRPLYRRMTLRRADGQVYLNRWGIASDVVGGVLVHKMEVPDPGIDLHDHPFWFASIVLWGGYTEQRADCRDASRLALEGWRGVFSQRCWLSVKSMRLDECHRITDLHGKVVWTLVIRGPYRRKWGFYLPNGYMDRAIYDETVRAERRDLWIER